MVNKVEACSEEVVVMVGHGECDQKCADRSIFFNRTSDPPVIAVQTAIFVHASCMLRHGHHSYICIPLFRRDLAISV